MNQGQPLSEKDLRLLHLEGEILKYQEALVVIKQQDHGLLRQACHFLDGHSPVIHSIAQAVRNLLDLWDGEPLITAEDDPPVDAESEPTPQPQPTKSKPYMLQCRRCDAVTYSTHRRRACPKCGAGGVKVSVRFSEGN